MKFTPVPALTEINITSAITQPTRAESVAMLLLAALLITLIATNIWTINLVPGCDPNLPTIIRQRDDP